MDIATLDSLRIVLDPIGQTGVALALMLVMFSVALGLRVEDFAFLRDKPLLFLGGVFSSGRQFRRGSSNSGELPDML